MDTTPREQGRLYFTSGLPRSGKSTYCDKWVRGETWSTNSGKPRVVVSADDFRLALHGQPFIEEAEPLIHAMVKTTIRALLIRGFDVIADETCLTEGQKASMRKIDPQAVEVPFTVTAAVCKLRAHQSGQDYLIPVIDRMANEVAVTVSESLGEPDHKNAVSNLPEKVMATNPRPEPPEYSDPYYGGHTYGRVMTVEQATAVGEAELAANQTLEAKMRAAVQPTKITKQETDYPPDTSEGSWPNDRSRPK